MPTSGKFFMPPHFKLTPPPFPKGISPPANLQFPEGNLFSLDILKKVLFLPPNYKGVPSLLRQGEKAENIPSNLIRIMPA